MKLESIRESLTRLTRLAQRRQAGGFLLQQALAARLADKVQVALDVAIETGDPIGNVFADLLESSPNGAIARALGEQLCEPPYEGAWTLKELSVRAFRQWLASSKSNPQKPLERRLEAFLYGRVGTALSLLGFFTEASRDLQRAIEIYRSLSSECDQDLAQVLAHAGENQANLGELKNALALTEEAVELMESLREEPEERSRLANGYHSLACRWIDVDRQERALKAIRNSVTLYEELRHQERLQIEAEYGRALMTEGNVLRYLERDIESIPVLEKAIRILRPLQSDRPHHFTPDLALALANYSLAAVHDNRREEAERAQTEATGLFAGASQYRELALRDRLAWTRGLRSYSRQIGGEEPLFNEQQQLVEIEADFQTLGSHEPLAWEPWLADHLESRAAQLLDAFEYEQALQVCDQGLNIWHRLEARQDLGSWRRSRAWTLLTRAEILNATGCIDKALDGYHLALDAFKSRPLDAAFYHTDLNAALQNFAMALQQAGKLQQALEMAEEAVDVGKGLLRNGPNPVSGPGQVEALNAVSILRHQKGDIDGALESSLASVALARSLYEKLNGSFAQALARMLSNLSIRLHHLERHDEAAAVLRESLGLFSELRTANVEPEAEAEAETHFMYGTILVELEQPHKAIPHLETALDLRNSICSRYADHGIQMLLVSHIALSEAFLRAERWQEALQSSEHALRLCKEKERGHQFPETTHWAHTHLWTHIAMARLELEGPRAALLAAEQARVSMHRRAALASWREVGSVASLLFEVYREACERGKIEPDLEFLKELTLHLIGDGGAARR